MIAAAARQFWRGEKPATPKGMLAESPGAAGRGKE